MRSFTVAAVVVVDVVAFIDVVFVDVVVVVDVTIDHKQVAAA